MVGRLPQRRNRKRGRRKRKRRGGISCEKSYKSSFSSSVPWYHMVPLVPGTMVGTSGTWYHTGSITSVFLND